jgi:hypothetical protein
MHRHLAIASTAAVALLAACTTATSAVSSSSAPARPSSDGTVTGRLVIEGGPPGVCPQQTGQGCLARSDVHPVPGTIKFAAGRRVFTTAAGESGSFTVRLPAGAYQVWTRTPRVQGPEGEDPFGHTATVTVTRGHTINVTLVAVYVP